MSHIVKAASELVADWITSHKWPLIVTLLAGAGIVGYGAMNFHKFKRIQNRIRANHNARQRYRGRAGKEKVISSLPSERRDVIGEIDMRWVSVISELTRGLFL
jgi:hypothetical protein